MDRGQQFEELLRRNGLSSQEQRNSSIKASQEAAEHHHRMFHEHINSQEYYFREHAKVNPYENRDSDWGDQPELAQGLMKSAEYHNHKAGFHEDQYENLVGNKLIVHTPEGESEAICSHCGKDIFN
jgi:hypothetical protein